MQDRGYSQFEWKPVRWSSVSRLQLSLLALSCRALWAAAVESDPGKRRFPAATSNGVLGVPIGNAAGVRGVNMTVIIIPLGGAG